MRSREGLFPTMLAVIIILSAIWSGIEPYSLALWCAEVIPVFIMFCLLVLTYRRVQFGNLSYFFLSLWSVLHLIVTDYRVDHILANALGSIVALIIFYFARLDKSCA